VRTACPRRPILPSTGRLCRLHLPWGFVNSNELIVSTFVQRKGWKDATELTPSQRAGPIVLPCAVLLSRKPEVSKWS